MEAIKVSESDKAKPPEIQVVDWENYSVELKKVSSKYIGLVGTNGIPEKIVVSNDATDAEIKALYDKLASMLK